jgi:hypothetical protein
MPYRRCHRAPRHNGGLPSVPVLQDFEVQVASSGGVFVLQFNDPSGDGDILLDEYQTTCCVNESPVGLFTFTNHPLQRWDFKRAPL